MSARDTPTAGYDAAVSGALQFAGVDQGIDFTGTGRVHAIGDGVIERLVHSGSGWPGKGALLVYRITDGPGKGRHVYVAEDWTIAAGLRTGATVRRGDVLGAVHSSWPGIEMGWASASGQPLAPLHPNPHGPKPEGRDFNAFVRGLAGLPAGLADAAGLGASSSVASSPMSGQLGCAALLLLELAIAGGIVAGAFYAFTGAMP